VAPVAPTGAVSFEVYHDLIQSIVAALEARDPHTAEHSLRVANMVERTARYLGLSVRDADAVHIAAHLHDIGKIGIPDAVLHKGARRTPEEHAVLREHARIGAEIVGSVPSLAPVAAMIRSHHERWDGAGYPDGLAGDEIPFGARVIAVCDSIDAMMGPRLAKTPLDSAACRAQIAEGAGRAYDPRVARTVLDHWDKIVRPVNFADSADFERRTPGCTHHLRCVICRGL
jgi:putative nucleotidyltransferase with HDIG domain